MPNRRDPNDSGFGAAILGAAALVGTGYFLYNIFKNDKEEESAIRAAQYESSDCGEAQRESAFSHYEIDVVSHQSQVAAAVRRLRR